MAIVSDRLQQYQKSIDEIHKQIEVSHFWLTYSGLLQIHSICGFFRHFGFVFAVKPDEMSEFIADWLAAADCYVTQYRTSDYMGHNAY